MKEILNENSTGQLRRILAFIAEIFKARGATFDDPFREEALARIRELYHDDWAKALSLAENARTIIGLKDDLARARSTVCRAAYDIADGLKKKNMELRGEFAAMEGSRDHYRADWGQAVEETIRAEANATRAAVMALDAERQGVELSRNWVSAKLALKKLTALYESSKADATDQKRHRMAADELNGVMLRKVRELEKELGNCRGAGL